MKQQTRTKRAPGRPRNEETNQSVLSVVRKLVNERGYEAVSVNLIAEEAGVAKQTLYRRWPSKAEIVLDAFLESAGGLSAVKYENLELTLTKFLRRLFKHLGTDGAAIRNLIASAQSDEAFRKQFLSRFVVPRAQVVADILQRAVEAGELPAGSRIDMLCDMIHGAFWYRLLTSRALDANYANALAKQLSHFAATGC